MKTTQRFVPRDLTSKLQLGTVDAALAASGARMGTSGARLNPFRAAGVRPQWAELARLAGDRAAILFQELRRRISKIEALREDLHYYGPEWGWVPRYRVGERTLFTALVLPGRLEATLSLEIPIIEGLLASPRVARAMKSELRSAPVSEGVATLRLGLSNQSLVRSFANLVVLRSRFLTPRGA